MAHQAPGNRPLVTWKDFVPTAARVWCIPTQWDDFSRTDTGRVVVSTVLLATVVLSWCLLVVLLDPIGDTHVCSQERAWWNFEQGIRRQAAKAAKCENRTLWCTHEASEAYRPYHPPILACFLPHAGRVFDMRELQIEPATPDLACEPTREVWRTDPETGHEHLQCRWPQIVLQPYGLRVDDRTLALQLQVALNEVQVLL